MMLESNFIEVTERVMIDPVAKIILSENRVDQDGNISFYVEFDPEILADRLQDDMSEAEVREYSFSRRPVGQYRKIKRSTKCIKLPEISCTRSYCALEGIALIRFPFDDLELKARITSRNAGCFTTESARVLYINIIDQITQMRVWDRLVQGWNKNNPESPVHRVRFDITCNLAAYIKMQIGKDFKQVSDTHSLLREREALP